MGSSQLRVLVVGYRRSLCRVLERQKIPYILWSGSAPIARLKTPLIHTQKLSSKKNVLDHITQIVKPHGPFSHVIAATEAAVVPASHMRRRLKTRLSNHSTVVACHDKLEMKDWLIKDQIPMTKYCVADGSVPPAELIRQLGTPVVIKERQSSGGRGMDICVQPTELQAALGPDKIAEKFVNAPEVSVESFVSGGQILFSNITEYVIKGHVNLVPATLAPALQKAILALNQKIIKALRLSWGMTHVEMYLTPGGPLFGEIALRPPGGYLMELLKIAYGFNAWEAFVSMELDLEFQFPQSKTDFAAVVVFHPGAGQVESIEGCEELKAHPNVVKLKVKAKPQQVIKARRGLGEDLGYVLLKAPDVRQLKEAIDFVRSRFQVRMISSPA